MFVPVAVLAACQGEGDDVAPAASGVGTTAVDTRGPGTGTAGTAPATDAAPTAGAPTPAAGSLYAPGSIDPGLAPWVEDATTDLADRLDVEEDAVEVISAVLVTWPDAALGCPEPGRQYATVATDGAVIELMVERVVYRYHAGGDRGPFPCPRPISQTPPPGA